MKNIVMLSVILAVVSVPRYLYAGDLKHGDSGGCLVDSSLNNQRFYYCGNQSFGCARETHDNSDYFVCNDGSEVQKKNGACFLTDGTKFTTRSGDTFYCCNGTSTSMGKIQSTACQSTGGLTLASGGGNGSGGQGSGGQGSGQQDGGDGSDQPEPPQPPQPQEGTNNGSNSGRPGSATGSSNSGQWGATNLDAFLDCDTSDIRNGFCPSTNGCVKCPSGKYFNEKDSANGCCSYAIGLTKTDMMYGYGKTQNSNPRLRNQCWTIKDIVRYRACVLSGVKKPMTIKVPIQSAMDTAVANTVSEK